MLTEAIVQKVIKEENERLQKEGKPPMTEKEEIKLGCDMLIIDSINESPSPVSAEFWRQFGT